MPSAVNVMLKLSITLPVYVQSCGKKRLILDLRYANQHIFNETITCEDWRAGLDYFEKKVVTSRTLKVTLKVGITHLDIFPDHQSFLWFSWVSHACLTKNLVSSCLLSRFIFSALLLHQVTQTLS